MAFTDQVEENNELELEEEQVNIVEDDTDELIRQAAFGHDIKISTSNPAVALVLTRAQASYVEAVKEFVSLDLSGPLGLHQAMQCQNDMKRYTDMVEWLTIAVQKGTKADRELARRRKEALHNRGMEAFYGTEASKPKHR